MELGGSLSREVPGWLGAAPTKLHTERVSQDGPLSGTPGWETGFAVSQRLLLAVLVDQSDTMGTLRLF